MVFDEDDEVATGTRSAGETEEWHVSGIAGEELPCPDSVVPAEPVGGFCKESVRLRGQQQFRLGRVCLGQQFTDGALHGLQGVRADEHNGKADAASVAGRCHRSGRVGECCRECGLGLEFMKVWTHDEVDRW